MKTKKIILLSLIGIGLTVSSCKKYLDALPDNRAELNTEAKVYKLLVSAYPQTSYIMVSELSSDNVDDYGRANPYTSRFYDELFRWKDGKEDDNDSPSALWEACYSAISSANEALQAIEAMGNPSTLNGAKGEALLARAYGHFLLVNIFSKHYSKANSATDLGIPYVIEPERTISVSYKRNSVKEVYDFIQKDIQEGLPLIDDTKFGSTPKFHMNTAAANAFAARVALYTQNWEQAISYANKAIGTNPTMRNTTALMNSGAQDPVQMGIFMNASTEKSNLFLQTAVSVVGAYFGPYYEGSRYSHGALIATTETWLTTAPWGRISSTGYKPRIYQYGGTNLDKVLAARAPYLFEYTDPVARIGYPRIVYAPFTVEETMLVRAEANIMLKKYDAAEAEMKRWVNNTLVNPPANFGINSINTWANNLAYFTPRNPTPKKKLNPEFPIEAGTQENMLHALLMIRRLETIQLGLRWFDVKRYGIEIERRVLSAGTDIESLETSSKLKVQDPRTAIQIPAMVISSGLEENPR